VATDALILGSDARFFFFLLAANFGFACLPFGLDAGALRFLFRLYALVFDAAQFAERKKNGVFTTLGHLYRSLPAPLRRIDKH
jgi:hypothetical protein